MVMVMLKNDKKIKNSAEQKFIESIKKKQEKSATSVPNPYIRIKTQPLTRYPEEQTTVFFGISA